MSSGHGKGWMYAQRGFARFKVENFQGAVEDFDAALSRRDLSPGSISDIRYTRSVAAAKLAERENRPKDAEADLSGVCASWSLRARTAGTTSDICC